MKFSEYILLYETQTISQWLKGKQTFTSDVISAIRQRVKFKLETIPCFQQQCKRVLDIFTNFFTYKMIQEFYNMMQHRNPQERNVLMQNWIQNDSQTLMTKISATVGRYWTGWGDYIAAHTTDNRIMSQFNTADLTDQQIDQAVEDWHEKLATQQSEEGGEGREIIDLSSIGWKGWKWLSLDRAYCKQEAGAMSHCGNAAYHEGDNILSLRDPENKVHLTFIVNDGILGESKGRANNKPSPKYHPAIIALLKSPYIQAIKGGGYKPENNFMMTDLDKNTRDALMKEKPGLGSVFKYLMKKSGKDALKALNDMFSEKFKAVKNGILTIETFETWNELYDYLEKYTNSKLRSNFSWLEDPYDLNVSIDKSDMISSLNYYLNKKEMQRLEAYLLVNKPEDIDEDEWNDMDLSEQLDHVPEIEDAVRNACYSGYEIGTQDEAYKDVTKQLSHPDDNGFYIDFNTHPWQLNISLEDLENVYNKDPDNPSIGQEIEINYDPPYNGYSDFSKEAFRERLAEELPQGILDKP